MGDDSTDLMAKLASLPALPEEAAPTPMVLAEELAAARRYTDASRAPATRRAYATDWAAFTTWCEKRGHTPLPAEPVIVGLFLAAEADSGLSPSTINRRRAAIGYHHRRAGFRSPRLTDQGGAIDEVVAGIRRTHHVAPKRKRPSTARIMRDMLDTIEGDGVRAMRDRAVLGLGLSGAFRRSELAALDVADLEFVPEGLRVTIRRSKADQEGSGAVVAVPEGRWIRPAGLVRAWLEVSGLRDGPLFRRLTRGDRLTEVPISDRFVARLVQRCAGAAGYPAGDYGAHSLRAGFLTESARAGASIFKMKEVSRHKSMQVLSDYVRDAALFENHAGERFL